MIANESVENSWADCLFFTFCVQAHSFLVSFYLLILCALSTADFLKGLSKSVSDHFQNLFLINHLTRTNESFKNKTNT